MWIEMWMSEFYGNADKNINKISMSKSIFEKIIKRKIYKNI